MRRSSSGDDSAIVFPIVAATEALFQPDVKADKQIWLGLMVRASGEGRLQPLSRGIRHRLVLRGQRYPTGLLGGGNGLGQPARRRIRRVQGTQEPRLMVPAQRAGALRQLDGF